MTLKLGGAMRVIELDKKLLSSGDKEIAKLRALLVDVLEDVELSGSISSGTIVDIRDAVNNPFTGV